jgi:hypothetical protein
MLRRSLLTAAFGLFVAAPTLAKARLVEASGRGPVNATLLIVRHAEKPDKDGGPGLTTAGQARAQAYVSFFAPRTSGASNTVWRDEPPRALDALVATEDTAKSSRPRLTLEPLSQALHLSIQQPCANDDVTGLARWLAEHEAGKTTLIAWHHGRIPKLLAALGADADALIPGGVWPDDTFDWVIELRYDADGRLILARRIEERLRSKA